MKGFARGKKCSFQRELHNFEFPFSIYPLLKMRVGFKFIHPFYKRQ